MEISESLENNCLNFELDMVVRSRKKGKFLSSAAACLSDFMTRPVWLNYWESCQQVIAAVQSFIISLTDVFPPPVLEGSMQWLINVDDQSFVE